MRSLDIDAHCFVCGEENHVGLKISFSADDGQSRAVFTPDTRHQGYVGMTHGGILAAVLDEAMIYAAASLGQWAATAELTVRYHLPAPTDRPLLLSGRVETQRRRLVECTAEARLETGELIASARGRLIRTNEAVAARSSSPLDTVPDAA